MREPALRDLEGRSALRFLVAIEGELEQENQGRRVNASANMGIHGINMPLTTEHQCRQELVPDERPIRGAKKK